jgi:hypothetical protein
MINLDKLIKIFPEHSGTSDLGHLGKEWKQYGGRMLGTKKVSKSSQGTGWKERNS